MDDLIGSNEEIQHSLSLLLTALLTPLERFFPPLFPTSEAHHHCSLRERLLSREGRAGGGSVDLKFDDLLSWRKGGGGGGKCVSVLTHCAGKKLQCHGQFLVGNFLPINF